MSSQVADYVCGIELAGVKCESGGSVSAEDAFFGGGRSFRKSCLKKVRKHRLAH